MLTLKENNEFIRKKLTTAMEYARNTCIIGSSNKIEDIEKTSGWLWLQTYRDSNNGFYIKQERKKLEQKCIFINEEIDLKAKGFNLPHKKWYYDVDKIDSGIPVSLKTKEDPITDPTFNLNNEHYGLIVRSLSATELRYGNCEALSCLVSKNLWQHSTGIVRIEGIKFRTFDHWLVVVNRPIKSLLHDSDTWGDAWVIDAWYKNGIVFPANQFKDKLKEIKDYITWNAKKLKELGIGQKKKFLEEGAEIDKVDWQIIPSIHHYPRYNKNKGPEDYYLTPSGYPKNFLQECSKMKEDHQQKFSSTLSMIKKKMF